jgi:MFS family permease
MPQPGKSPHPGWTLAAAILGSSMAFADGTIANVALPAIQSELGADASQAQWVIEACSLFLASVLSALAAWLLIEAPAKPGA